MSRQPSRAGVVLVAFLLALTALTLAADLIPDEEKVGSRPDGSYVVPTGQIIKPAGTSLAFKGRPVDIALSSDGKTLFAKDNRGLVVVDVATWKVAQELSFPKGGGGSMHGLVVSRDGRRVFATTAQQHLNEAEVGGDGKVTWKRAIDLPGPGGKGASHACGFALTADEQTAYVCLSRNNSLGVVDLKAGNLTKEIAVGVAPFDVVLSADGRTAFVSNWGGRRAKPKEKTADSSGTQVLVDERGVASSGTVGRVDLIKGEMTSEVETGLHPSDLVLSLDARTLFVANANSDTVCLLDPEPLKVRQTLTVRPDPDLPFGSATNALALSADGRTLFAANGGNNAVAVIALGDQAAVTGFIPPGWYPGGVVADGRHLFIANVKGEGSRTPDPKRTGWSSYDYRGTLTRVAIPDAEQLRTMTEQVKADARVPQVLRALEKAQKGVKPVPVPKRWGEPSVFEHIIYVIKENRTYDQVFGDIKEGNGDPKLCIYGEEITPNHHALARQFVLLDNFYCNGVLSADGHSWATEGNVTDHLEKSFGGFTRSYTFGDDPLTYSSTGFLWDNVLLRGLSFRNFGEMDYAEPVPAKATFQDIWDDYDQKKGKITFKQSIGIETLKRYSAPDYPGWNMKIPDVLRVDAFLKEFREAEKKGQWPNLVIVFLPQDHTSGTTPGMPTPRAHMADNDLALGRLVEAVSQSVFWPKTCLFVIEDDPQNGFDHVDGHRSIGLVASPYTKRGAVVSKFYNQTSVLHTMQRMLGLPPMNQMDALAPVMADCFTEKRDVTPYKALDAKVPLNELNKKKEDLNDKERGWALKSEQIDFTKCDAADEDKLNRILWHAAKGVDAPYPAQWAGAHGKGLQRLGLRLVPGDDDD